MKCPASDRPSGWWDDAELLRQDVEHHGSFAATARVHGIADSTLKSAWAGHDLPKRGQPKPVPHTAKIVVGDEWLLKALKKHGNKAPIDVLADEGDVSPRRVRDALKRLGFDGYRIGESEGRVVLNRVLSPEQATKLTTALFDGRELIVGIVSDTHIGSNEEALAELHLAYEIFMREGVREVWHAGDISCGVGVFRGQHSEAKVHTLDQARDYVVDNYPRCDGIVTRAIGGNHDLEGDAGKVGMDLAEAICNRRDDMEYLGPFSARIRVGGEHGADIELLHGKGGMSYAYSYKAQKLVSGYPGGYKPAVLIPGHWHVRASLEDRSVQVLFPGCFEWQSPFMKRLGLQPAVGFHIVRMVVGEDGSIVQWEPRWYKFYAGRTIEAGA